MDASDKVKKQQEQRKRMIAKGPWYFIIIFGVIGWGIPTALLFSLIMPYFNDSLTFVGVLKEAIIFFPLGGIFYGFGMWWWVNRSFKKQSPS